MLPMKSSNLSSVRTYYNELAPDYDSNRFGNSYGKYVDSLERKLIRKWIPAYASMNVLDAACGTGRLLNFAGTGVDFSPEMCRIAQNKFPSKEVFCEDLQALHFPDNSFDVIICFHVFMHLDHKTSKQILKEFQRILKTGGRVILDIPSAKRRSLGGWKKVDWHGASQYHPDEFENLAPKALLLNRTSGLLFLPIHRIPPGVRSILTGLDSFMSNSFLKQYASYWAMEFVKKGDEIA